MNGLNPEQQAAVNCGEGVFQVLAGPGSGKTKTLVARHNRLWDLEYNVLSLTFTRSAAQEMRDRGVKDSMTIPSLAYRLLTNKFGHDFNTDLDSLVPQAAQVFFDETFDYVQVDEAQDCDDTDWLFLQRLSKNILAVGDFQQALFSWRGAAPDLFLNMPERFPGCQTLTLSTNYRSTKKIVEFCRSIAPFRGELLSRMCTDNEEGDPVEFLSFDNNVAEADGVLNLARKLSGSTAILARTNHQLDVFRKLELASCIYDLMTVHKAKGSEFENVFLVGAQNGLLPIKNGDLDEEARILFVAASRAKKRLFISNYGTRSKLLNKEKQ